MGHWVGGKYFRDPDEQAQYDKAQADLDHRIKNAVFVVHLCKSAEEAAVCIGCKRKTFSWEGNLTFHEVLTPKYFNQALTTPWTRNGTRQICEAALVATVMQS
jgi:hypothetical protein